MNRNNFVNVDRLLTRDGPFTADGFTPGETVDFIHEDCRILVVGAGGLGCELLKDLALMGFKDIHVIDMDTIEVSNLNRQFLFRKHDVGKSKAVVAAEFVNNRVKGVNVTPHHCILQEKDETFYRQFNIVISGLDSIEARRWINGMLVSLVEVEESDVEGEEAQVNMETVIPFIDGGTEGFKGHARVILPRLSACFECTIEMFPPRVNVPMCTLATTPRSPEHCIEYVSMVEWPKHRKDVKIDCDDPEHVQWLYEKALSRSKEFNISGVTLQLTLGVVKHIIPAIASTNAYIAALCVNEAFKIASSTAAFLNNYHMYNGGEGSYSHTFEYEKKKECVVCGMNATTYINVSPTSSLQDLIDEMKEDLRFQVKNPSIRNGTKQKNLYMAGPPFLEQATRPNLELLLTEMVDEGDVLTVTDASLPAQYSIALGLKYNKE